MKVIKDLEPQGGGGAFDLGRLLWLCQNTLPRVQSPRERGMSVVLWSIRYAQ